MGRLSDAAERFVEDDIVLEPMRDFFESRLDGYDEHMLTGIACAAEFYPYTAGCLPREENCRLLDLGCGTGLELEAYFARIRLRR